MQQKYLIAIIVLCSFMLSIPAWGEETGRLFVGWSNKTLIDVDAKDANAAMRNYVTEIGKRLGLNAKAVMYDNIEVLIRDVDQGNIDLFSIRSFDYLRMQKRLSAEAAITYTKNGKTATKYLLLVRKEGSVSHLKDLRHKKLSLQKGDDIIPLFLNTTLLREGYPEMQGFFSSIEEKAKPSQVVLSVFFGKTDACVIEDSAFKTITELNPQVGKTLKILVESPEVVGSMSFFRRDLPEETKAKVLQKSIHLQDDPRGKQVLMLFKIEGVVKGKESDMDSLKSMMAEYERLRKKGAPRFAQGG